MKNNSNTILVPAEIKRRNTLVLMAKCIAVLNGFFDNGVRTYQGFKTIVGLRFPQYLEREQVLRSFWHCKSLEKNMLAEMEQVLNDLKAKKYGSTN